VRRDGVSKTDAFSIQVLLDVQRNNRDHLDWHAAYGNLQEDFLRLRRLQITVRHFPAAVLDRNFPIRKPTIDILQCICYCKKSCCGYLYVEFCDVNDSAISLHIGKTCKCISKRKT